MKLPLNVDLIAIINQALPQIFGSDERALLAEFLSRYTDFDSDLPGLCAQLPIKLDLSTCIIKSDEPGG